MAPEMPLIPILCTADDDAAIVTKADSVRMPFICHVENGVVDSKW